MQERQFEDEEAKTKNSTCYLDMVLIDWLSGNNDVLCSKSIMQKRLIVKLQVDASQAGPWKILNIASLKQTLCTQFHPTHFGLDCM